MDSDIFRVVAFTSVVKLTNDGSISGGSRGRSDPGPDVRDRMWDKDKTPAVVGRRPPTLPELTCRVPFGSRQWTGVLSTT